MDKTERQQVRGWLGIDLEQYSHIVHCQLCDITTIDDRMKQLDLTHERIKSPDDHWLGRRATDSAAGVGTVCET